MKAMILPRCCDLSHNDTPLRMVDLPVPEPREGEILVEVTVCGVCHTELDEIEGRTPPKSFPAILGHQTVGRVVRLGVGADRFQIGDRVGIAWIHSACGSCELCRAGQENLCPDFCATGRDVNGGYAEYTTVPEIYAYHIPDCFSDAEAAPMLCAGAIGYRSLRLAGLRDGQRLGLTGFGASGHLVLKIVRHRFPATEVFVFARSEGERVFARELGAVWVGDSDDRPPQLLHAIIDTTPVWRPIISALGNLVPGGRLTINAIRKEELDKESLLELDYPRDLWLEKEIKSVANVTRADVSEFLELAAEVPLKPEYQLYPLEEANRALLDLKRRRIRGAKVLQVKTD
ncbi:MAG: zinc-dependent alcohol dehydrogenase family protein [Candidatus Delongbacteria bacterium]|nr:zinc-dependent alcohol dehydrogenase family protein [Candidatus Delongbacteria bacterium]